MKKVLWVTIMVLGFVPNLSISDTCFPEKGSKFKVTNVQPTDTLNVRTGETTSFPVIDQLAHNQTGIISLGEVKFKSNECMHKCEIDKTLGDNHASKDKNLEKSIINECIGRSKIWYKIVTPNNVVGWASGKYLKLQERVNTDDFDKFTEKTISKSNPSKDELENSKDSTVAMLRENNELLSEKVEELKGKKSDYERLKIENEKLRTEIKNLSVETDLTKKQMTQTDVSISKNIKDKNDPVGGQMLDFPLSGTEKGSLRKVYSWVDACKGAQCINFDCTAAKITKYLTTNSPLSTRIDPTNSDLLEPIDMFNNFSSDKNKYFLRTYAGADKLFCHFYLKGVLMGYKSYNEILSKELQ
jgi:hypothetical protein